MMMGAETWRKEILEKIGQKLDKRRKVKIVSKGVMSGGIAR